MATPAADPKKLLAYEAKAARLLALAVKPALDPVLKVIATALEHGAYDAAREYANKITLNSVYDDVPDMLHGIGNKCAALGHSLCSAENVQKSVFAFLVKADPKPQPINIPSELVELATRQVALSIKYSGVEAIRAVNLN